MATSLPLTAAVFFSAACALAIMAPEVTAQGGYPARAVRLVIPSSSGSGIDLGARLISQPLSERLGQQIVVDNRAGAGTMIGSEIVAKSPPDGYTLLMSPSTLAINPAMFKKVPYDALRDFAPITQIAAIANVLAVHPSLPAKSVKELIALGKARPGDITFASAGTGSNPHLAMELFLVMTKTRMLHVPYKGSGPAFIDLVAGRVEVMTSSTVGTLPHVRNGRLRALGVTTAKRAVGLPDVPTIAEAGVPGYEAVQWWGLLAPAGTPAEIIARLHKDVTAVLLAPDIKERYAKDGAEVVVNTPGEFAAYMAAETAKWAKVVKSAGIRPE